MSGLVADESSSSGSGSCVGNPNVRLIPINDQIRELQTVLRTRSTSQGDFVFTADRLIRLVIEEGLNWLPYSACKVVTPTGHTYAGLNFAKGNCGVSIIRSGEVMEKGLRDCCRSMRIGKILIQSDPDTHEARVVYAKLVPDISSRKVLLMYPIMSSGNTVKRALAVLKDYGVKQQNIILLNLFSSPKSIENVLKSFPEIKIITSEINATTPNHFGQKYFGTD